MTPLTLKAQVPRLTRESRGDPELQASLRVMSEGLRVLAESLNPSGARVQEVREVREQELRLEDISVLRGVREQRIHREGIQVLRGKSEQKLHQEDIKVVKGVREKNLHQRDSTVLKRVNG